MIAPFRDDEALRNALIAGVLIAVVSAFAGTFVVLRGIAFVGDALGHGVLPGVAAAMLLGLPGILGAAVGAVVMVAGVTYVVERTGLSSDTAIGLLFVGMLALGVLIVSQSDSFEEDIDHLLFGEVLGVRTADLVWLALAAVAVAATVALFHRPFLLLSLDPEQAEIAGFPRRRYHLLMLAVVALAVVASFEAVGTLLVFGMLIAPAATAALISRRLSAMVISSAAIGTLCVYVGLLLSHHFDLEAGASIVGLAVAVFFAVAVGAPLLRRSGSTGAAR